MGENYAFNEQNSFKACPGTMALDLSHSRGGLSYVGRYHALAEIIAGFLGTLFQPQAILNTAWSAIRAALAAAVFTFLAQLLKGLLEYRTAAKAREGMRKMIFSKVLELDAGGIEKIGPVSAITASVDAVEQMQTYFSTYLPSLIYSVIAPIYLFLSFKEHFHACGCFIISSITFSASY